jgi:phospholipid/cholesterol/gamma-HCH transport system ATP-binding protein
VGDPPAIELVDVHTAFEDEWVLRGVSFVVPADGITVMLGPSGVGKTTCVRHITGLLLPNDGDVLVEGKSRLAMRKAEHLALSRRFGVLLQGSGMHGSALWGSMTVLENLIFQLRALSDVPEDQLRERALERLKEVGLAEHADVMPVQLSAGMARRVALARALVSDPDFVMLDSFDDGVDPVRLGRLCELIKWHHETFGGTYLVATHDMDVAQRIADHVVVLWEGTVVEQGPTAQVFGSARPEVHQLLTGAEEGPLGMYTERDPAKEPPPLPAEQGLEVPVPVATLVTLVVITGSVLFLGQGHVVEVAILILVWIAAAALIAARLLRARQ